MSSSKEKILFVDDDENLLAGIRRQVGRKFNVETAVGAVEAIKLLGTSGPYAIIVSDMRMPGMDGIQFLRVAKQRFPNSVRIMLTGNADLDTAMNAVNEGEIFRFVTKPCPAQTMEKVLEAAMKQYDLQQGEKALLESTVNGSIKVLTDVLAITNPLAFSRANRIKHFVSQIAQCLKLPNVWQYEMAALLSQVGFVTVPAKTLEKIYNNTKLSSAEMDMVKRYPKVGHDIIANIPRLEEIARMIALHQEDFDKDKGSVDVCDRDVIELGAEILKVAAHFDTFLYHSGTENKVEAVARMKKNASIYNPHVLDVLESLEISNVERSMITVKVVDLKSGMMMYDTVVTDDGMLLATKGQELTEALIVLLDNHAQQGKIRDTVAISQ